MSKGQIDRKKTIPNPFLEMAIPPSTKPEKKKVHQSGVPLVFSTSRSTADHLSGQQVVDLYDGISSANKLGVIFDTHVTVSWSFLGMEDQASAHAAFKVFKERFQKLFQDRNLDCFYVFVHESSQSLGVHTHFLTHLPSGSADQFLTWIRRSLARLAGLQNISDLPSATFKVRHRKSAKTSEKINRQWIWFRYLCKGIDPEAWVIYCGVSFLPRLKTDAFDQIGIKEQISSLDCDWTFIDQFRYSDNPDDQLLAALYDECSANQSALKDLYSKYSIGVDQEEGCEMRVAPLNEVLGIHKRYSTGKITFKRSGMSNNIGGAAQGYHSTLNFILQSTQDGHHNWRNLLYGEWQYRTHELYERDKKSNEILKTLVI